MITAPNIRPPPANRVEECYRGSAIWPMPCQILLLDDQPSVVAARLHGNRSHVAAGLIDRSPVCLPRLNKRRRVHIACLLNQSRMKAGLDDGRRIVIADR